LTIKADELEWGSGRNRIFLICTLIPAFSLREKEHSPLSLREKESSPLSLREITSD